MTSTTPALERRDPNTPAATLARTGGRHVALSPRAARRAARLEDASWTASAEEERRHVDLVPTKRPSAPRAKSSFAKRAKPFATFGVMTLATGLFVSVSLPAAAAGVDVDAATGGAIPSAATMQSVSYSVPSTATDVPFVRDGYGATSQEEVDAASAAAAAAAAEAAASASAASSSSASASAGRTYAAPAVARSGEAILAYAAQFVGVVPYGNGNDPSDSFACDGYVQYVFAAFGVSLPRGAGAQAASGVQISASEAVAGDLLYWPEGHIAIYDGAGGMYDSPDWGRYVQHRLTIWGDPVYIRIP
ncbi:NlpC/P60 family protein [uncultured Plantibacter sp.]|uniref:C40 family peptidase n=1 Tax=uncultured Plantibacter sp. TaxID=293337 RepID=UPI0028D73D43|nr:NlpC/P60 family protein [uncultured Plantibacter sp.]